MAKQRDLIQRADIQGEKGYYVKEAHTVVFAADATITETDTLVSSTSPTGDTWPIMTPVYFDAVGKWKVWNDLAGTIDGFLIGATGHSTASMHAGVSGQLQLDVALDVQGVVMLTGDVDYESIFSPEDDKAYVSDILAAGGTVDADLVNALLTGPRTKGMMINNLANVH